MSLRCPSRRLLVLALGGLPLFGLSGCLFVTDTSRMNPDVFVKETTPTWNVPVAPPPPPANRFRNLFVTPFHNTYGAPTAVPSSAAPGAGLGDISGTGAAGAAGVRQQSSVEPAVGGPVTGSIAAAGLPSGPVSGPVSGTRPASPFANPDPGGLYAQMRDDGHTLNAIPVSRVDPRFLRQTVAYQTREKPGTIVVDTANHYLYFVEGGGRAVRYGVGLGKQGYAWRGRGVIASKKTWPRWVPSDEMVSRQPELKPFSARAGGLVAGTANPLGARALYIFQNGKDTLYRIHGTPDWQSVGKATSSGCVRMFNQDVIDLYDRVGSKAEIVVI